MGLASGVHHLAISTADLKGQLEFFTDVLGAELKALYWLHGVPGAKHAFVRLNDSSYVAFVHMPAIEEIPTELGVTHSGNPAAVCAPGTMQHVAFNVETLDDLLALRDRIRSRGINVFGPLNHGMCQSIYFAGPEHLSLEIATSAAPIDDRAWIDPEVVALCGIDEDELQAEKEAMIAEFSLSLDRPLEVARLITKCLASGMQLDQLDAYAKLVNVLTKQEIDEAIRRHFRIDKAVTVVAGQLA